MGLNKCRRKEESNTEVDKADVDLNIDSTKPNDDILIESLVFQHLQQESFSLFQDDTEIILGGKSEAIKATAQEKIRSTDVFEEKHEDVNDAMIVVWFWT